MLVYMFIFLYGAQVMRGVIEEKTNRIVEVIISSVKPFQLMMGKIIGIALVGIDAVSFMGGAHLCHFFSCHRDFHRSLTRFRSKCQQRTSALGHCSIPDQEAVAAEMDSELGNVFNAINSINFPLLIGTFLFYFLGGYLLYGALFAAIGSAVDAESDTQQFMLPITIPLILSIVVSQSILQNPESSLAFWFSMIPFTSPVVMMVRIPFGVAPWELALVNDVYGCWVSVHHLDRRSYLQNRYPDVR
jgi:ABC-2 type transport system permease protein